jgi:hypothetical protein
VQDESAVPDVGILIKMIDPIGVKERRTTFDAVNLVSLRQQQFGKVRAVLPRNTGDQRALRH